MTKRLGHWIIKPQILCLEPQTGTMVNLDSKNPSKLNKVSFRISGNVVVQSNLFAHSGFIDLSKTNF